MSIRTPATAISRWLVFLVCAGLAGWLGLSCQPEAPAPTPTPTKTPFATPFMAPRPTNTPVPTFTPQPSTTPQPQQTTAATATPIPVPPSPAATPTLPLPTATRPPAARPPLPPQQGGEWDMEAGFVPGTSPLGPDCPGWAVAVGWHAFLAPGTPASSCLNENKLVDNVHSGQRSQEITFDFIQAEAGILRTAQTIPGHRYQIEAWGKHIHSASPVELSLGVDLTGGQDWQAGSVTWTPWDDAREDVWAHTQVVVRARGNSLTVFLRGQHPRAVQGGATLFDDVRVVDLGP
ncbi:MAG: hypothetical protein KKA73_19445 [Chloroflexi bacterium]|nr:hypothetical protein [Chloroflexota bacterium]MBU1749862.1 hypothetical protein [Chloroflexota bacterium]